MPADDWRRRWLIPIALGCIVAFSLAALGIAAWTGLKTYETAQQIHVVGLQNQALAQANRDLLLETRTRAARQAVNTRHLAELLALERAICKHTQGCVLP